MIRKKITVSDILTFLDNDVIRVEGETEGVWIDNLCDAAHITCTSLDWVGAKRSDKQVVVETSKARVVLVDETVEYSPVMKQEAKILIVVNNPKLALAKVGNYFYVEKPIAEIHPTAIVHPNAVIGLDVSIGPYSVVGNVVIGDGCDIDSNVRIYDGVTMGEYCSVKAGAILGGAGFGFEKDEEGNRFRFPQIGGLVIGNHVEIGSNTCIDRGALSDTIIGDYTKINNLCHIAHNNVIGRNVEITGCVNISGSNMIDDNVWIAPNASVRGYLHIGENATIGMGAVVTKDIPANEVWIGNPAHKMEKNK